MAAALLRRMRNLITLAAVIGVAACSKATPVPTIPESLLPETNASIPEEEVLPPVERDAEPEVVEVAPPTPVVAAAPTEAIATLAPTTKNKVHGTVAFQTVNAAVQITASFTGLAAGTYAIRVHSTGDCSAPDGSSAGDALTDGEIGQLTADDQGAAELTRSVAVSSLPIIGLAVVVESLDGANRLACGVVGVKEAEPVLPPPTI